MNYSAFMQIANTLRNRVVTENWFNWFNWFK